MDPHLTRMSRYGMVIPLPGYVGAMDLDVRLIQDDAYIGSSKIELYADSPQRMAEYLDKLHDHVGQALREAQKAAAGNDDAERADRS